MSSRPELLLLLACYVLCSFAFDDITSLLRSQSHTIMTRSTDSNKFGHAISMDASGLTLAIGEHEVDRVNVYTRAAVGDVWELAWADALSLSTLGVSVDLSADGCTLVAGGHNYSSGRGVARVYRRGNGSSPDVGSCSLSSEWQTTKTIFPGVLGDSLGLAVRLSADSLELAVGSHGADSLVTSNTNVGKVVIYRRNATEEDAWPIHQELRPSVEFGNDGYFGYYSAFSPNQEWLAIGCRGVDKLFMFRKMNGTWTEHSVISAGGFLSLSAFSADSRRLCVGDVNGQSSGQAFLLSYDESEHDWQVTTTFDYPGDTPSTPNFGQSCQFAYNDKILFVGAYQDDGKKGSVFTYYNFGTIDAPKWTLIEHMKGVDGNEYLGTYGVAFTDDLLEIFAGAFGVAPNRGALYTFNYASIALSSASTLPGCGCEDARAQATQTFNGRTVWEQSGTFMTMSSAPSVSPFGTVQQMDEAASYAELFSANVSLTPACRLSAGFLIDMSAPVSWRDEVQLGIGHFVNTPLRVTADTSAFASIGFRFGDGNQVRAGVTLPNGQFLEATPTPSGVATLRANVSTYCDYMLYNDPSAITMVIFDARCGLTRFGPLSMSLEELMHALPTLNAFGLFRGAHDVAATDRTVTFGVESVVYTRPVANTLDACLAHWWRADDGLQSITSSVSLAMFNSVPIDAAGVWGTAFSFSGGAGWLDVDRDADDLQFDDDEAFALSFWFMASTDDDGVLVRRLLNYGVFWNGTDTPLLFYDGDEYVGTRALYESNTWYHVALVSAGARVGRLLELYVDGRIDMVTTSTFSGRGTRWPTAIGAALGPAGEQSDHFDGRIDELMVFSGTYLTPAHVWSLFTNPSSILPNVTAGINNTDAQLGTTVAIDLCDLVAQLNPSETVCFWAFDSVDEVTEQLDTECEIRCSGVDCPSVRSAETMCGSGALGLLRHTGTDRVLYVNGAMERLGDAEQWTIMCRFMLHSCVSQDHREAVLLAHTVYDGNGCELGEWRVQCGVVGQLEWRVASHGFGAVALNGSVIVPFHWHHVALTYRDGVGCMAMDGIKEGCTDFGVDWSSLVSVSANTSVECNDTLAPTPLPAYNITLPRSSLHVGHAHGDQLAFGAIDTLSLQPRSPSHRSSLWCHAQLCTSLGDFIVPGTNRSESASSTESAATSTAGAATSTSSAGMASSDADDNGLTGGQWFGVAMGIFFGLACILFSIMLVIWCNDNCCSDDVTLEAWGGELHALPPRSARSAHSPRSSSRSPRAARSAHSPRSPRSLHAARSAHSPRSTSSPRKRKRARHQSSDIESRFIIAHDRLEKRKKLGEGAYGVVYRGLMDGEAVAIKRIKVESDEARDDFLGEALSMQSLPPHRNVVLLYGVCRHPLSIVQEFCELGSLHAHLYGARSKSGLLTDKSLPQIVLGTARGLAHLHRNQIVHRDVAARNVLLTSTLVPKLCDFGMARQHDTDTVYQRTATTIGPVKWMAPEQLTSMQFSLKSDVYSFGVVLYEIYARKEPWDGVLLLVVPAKVLQGERLDVGVAAIPNVKKLMERCFAFVPGDRPSMRDVLRDLHEAIGTNADEEDEDVDAEPATAHYHAYNTASLYSRPVNYVPLAPAQLTYAPPCVVEGTQYGVADSVYVELSANADSTLQVASVGWSALCDSSALLAEMRKLTAEVQAVTKQLAVAEAKLGTMADKVGTMDIKLSSTSELVGNVRENVLQLQNINEVQLVHKATLEALEQRAAAMLFYRSVHVLLEQAFVSTAAAVGGSVCVAAGSSKVATGLRLCGKLLSFLPMGGVASGVLLVFASAASSLHANGQLQRMQRVSKLVGVSEAADVAILAAAALTKRLDTRLDTLAIQVIERSVAQKVLTRSKLSKGAAKKLLRLPGGDRLMPAPVQLAEFVVTRMICHLEQLADTLPPDLYLPPIELAQQLVTAALRTLDAGVKGGKKSKGGTVTALVAWMCDLDDELALTIDTKTLVPLANWITDSIK